MYDPSQQYNQQNFQGYGAAPSGSSGKNLRVKLRKDERDYYTMLFESCKNKKTNKIEGTNGVAFLKKSSLEIATIKAIWKISAQTNPKSLEKEEFFVALRLIALAQNGMEVSEGSIINDVQANLPAFESIPMPTQAPQSYGSSEMHPPSTAGQHAMTYEDFSKYSRIFDNKDTTKNGYIDNEQMIKIMQSTGLPNEQLKIIYDFASQVNENQIGFDKLSTIMVMHIMYKNKTGSPIPQQLPQDLINTIKGYITSPPSNSIPQQNPPSNSNSMLPLPAPQGPQYKSKEPDPFADLGSGTSFGMGGTAPLYSYPQLPAPSYESAAQHPSQPSYNPINNYESIKPPPPMPTYIQATRAAPSQPKIEHNMQSVIDEQDSELFKSSNFSRDEPTQIKENGIQSKALIDQLQALKTEEVKLKKSIYTQRALYAKEEESMRQCQAEITQTQDEYVRISREIEEMLKQKIENLERNQRPTEQTYVNQSNGNFHPTQTQPKAQNYASPPRQAPQTMAPRNMQAQPPRNIPAAEPRNAPAPDPRSLQAHAPRNTQAPSPKDAHGTAPRVVHMPAPRGAPVPVPRNAQTQSPAPRNAQAPAPRNAQGPAPRGPPNSAPRGPPQSMPRGAPSPAPRNSPAPVPRSAPIAEPKSNPSPQVFQAKPEEKKCKRFQSISRKQFGSTIWRI